MASILSMRILLLLCACLSSILIINALKNEPSTNHKHEKTFFSRKFARPNANLSAQPSSNVQQRNVIMPRICYFARISGTAVYQRLCLPYDDEDDGR